MSISVKSEMGAGVDGGERSGSQGSSGSSGSQVSVVNHPGTERDRNNLSMLQSFILSTTQPSGSKGGPPREALFVKRESEGALHFSETSHRGSVGADTVSSANSSRSGKKQRKVSSKSDRQKRPRTERTTSTSTTNITSPSATDTTPRSARASAQRVPLDSPPRNPPALERLHSLLFEVSGLPDPNAIADMSTLIDSVFDEVKEDEGMEFCLKQTGLSIGEWVQEGERLTKRHTELVTQLVELRVGLSYKFKVIVDMINEHAEHLVAQETQLDEKLLKIRSIGKDMINLL